MEDPGPIHAVGCSDTNFSVAKLRPFFRALRDAHPGEDLRYHHLTVGGTEAFRKPIADYCASIGLPIAFHEVGDQVAQAFAGGVEEGTKWTLAIYGRLFMAEVLPPEVERAVYMDFDTICLGNLRELLAESKEGEAVGAAINLPDFCSAGRKDYFNAGVLVVPVAAWRRNRTAAQLAELFLAMKREERPLRFYDQDLLNAHFAGRIHEIPRAWNAQAFVEGAGGCVPVSLWRKSEMRQPKLVHYAGVTKPWATPTTWMAFPRPAALAYARALVACAWEREHSARNQNQPPHFPGQRPGTGFAGFASRMLALPGASAFRRWFEMTAYRILSIGSLELAQGSFRLRLAHRFAEVVSGRESPLVVFRWLRGAFSRRIR